MKSVFVSRGLLVLLGAGALAVLLLGAFSRDPSAKAPVTANLTAVDSPENNVVAAGEPQLPAGLSPGLGEIIRLAQAHVDESVILSFIQNSSETYAPTAEEILYLFDLGLSQDVIAALYKGKIAPPPAVAKLTEPRPVLIPRVDVSSAPLARASADDSENSFYKSLAPYGAWTELADYGPVWQPTVETVDPDWRPYADQGQWLYTANGWYWQSAYTWGWAVFHYGRWVREGRLGWVWVPDSTWGPAWVSWRIALSYSGWAPLPPGATVSSAGGLTFHSRRVGADFDFGLPPSWFVFVKEGNLMSKDVVNYTMSDTETTAIFGRSLTVNNYTVARQKIFNGGPGPVAVATGAKVIPLETAAIEFTSSPDVSGLPPISDKSAPLLASLSAPPAIPDILLHPVADLAPASALPAPAVKRPRRHYWGSVSTIPPNAPNTHAAVHKVTFVENDGVHAEPAAHSAVAPPQAVEPERTTASAVPATSKSPK